MITDLGEESLRKEGLVEISAAAKLVQLVIPSLTKLFLTQKNSRNLKKML